MNKPEKLQPIPPQAGMPYYYYPQENETSLADCYFILNKQKKTFFVIVALGLIGALIFALLSTPVYKAEAGRNFDAVYSFKKSL